MGLKDWINEQDSSGILTREVLDASFEAIKNAPPDPCSLGRHVVSVTAVREGWRWATCGNCYRLVSLAPSQPSSVAESQ